MSDETTELRKALDFMRIWISDDAHLGESEFSYELEKAEGLRKLEAIEQAIAATLGAGECAQCAKDMGAYADSLCDPLKERINKLLRCLENGWHISASWDGLRKFWCIELTDEGVRMRDAEIAGGTLTAEQVMAIAAKHQPDYCSDTHACFDWQAIADELNELGSEINGDTSDGYHTFNELYHHRAVLFSVIVRDHRELAWKARKHHDGTMYDGMFIVGIETPKGQATYHYDLDPYWEMFDCEEREYAPEWDGHTPDEAIARIAELGSEREKRLEKLVGDLWQGHECGAGCAMYEECRHPLDDRCPMEERVAELIGGA